MNRLMLYLFVIAACVLIGTGILSFHAKDDPSLSKFNDVNGYSAQKQLDILRNKFKNEDKLTIIAYRGAYSAGDYDIYTKNKTYHASFYGKKLEIKEKK